MKKHLISNGEYPEDNEYVLARIISDSWRDSSDPEGNRYFKVVQFRRGISQEDRQKLDDEDPRKKTWKNSDQCGNNLYPYCWDEFGPGCYFAQEVEEWWRLSELG